MAYGFNDNKSKYTIPNPLELKISKQFSGQLASQGSGIWTGTIESDITSADLADLNFLNIYYSVGWYKASAGESRYLVSDAVVLHLPEMLSYVVDMGDEGANIVKHYGGFKNNVESVGVSSGEVDVMLLRPGTTSKLRLKVRADVGSTAPSECGVIFRVDAL